MLHSSGSAAEYNGAALGEYVEEGEYAYYKGSERRPYFKQMDTEGKTDHFLCTRF